MDVQLPGIDGLELTRRLKADPATRDIKILGLTAYAMKGDREKYWRPAATAISRSPSIRVRSRPAGTLFRKLTARLWTPMREPLLTPMKILVVEDNPISRKLTRLALETEGFGV